MFITEFIYYNVCLDGNTVKSQTNVNVLPHTWLFCFIWDISLYLKHHFVGENLEIPDLHFEKGVFEWLSARSPALI